MCGSRLVQGSVSTHDMQMEAAIPCGMLADIGDAWKEYDVIGIDEGQFFPDLIAFAEAAANAGKIVIIAALDGTFQRKVRCNRILFDAMQG